MHQPRLAEQGQQVLVAHDIGDAGVDAPLDLVRQAARDQLFAELDELATVDRGFLVGKDEEADLMVVHQPLDFVRDLLGVAHPVISPELPLAAETAGERAAPRHVGNRHPNAQRRIQVFRPVKDRPVRADSVQILDGRRGLRRYDLGSVQKGQPLDLAPVLRPAALGACLHQGCQNLFALAPHDHIDPRRFRQDLPIHERRVDAAQHPQRTGHHFGRNLENLFGHIDRRGDRRRAHNIGRNRRHPCPQVIIRDVVRHRVDEVDVIEPRRPQRP